MSTRRMKMEGWRWTGGHEAVVRLLVELGADVNAKNKDGGTALHRAENYVCPDLERKRVAALQSLAKSASALSALENFCPRHHFTNCFYSVPFPSIYFHRKVIRSIEKILEWPVSMVASYLEHYIYLCNPRPLPKIES
jgi:hypothetical protein